MRKPLIMSRITLSNFLMTYSNLHSILIWRCHLGDSERLTFCWCRTARGIHNWSLDHARRRCWVLASNPRLRICPSSHTVSVWQTVVPTIPSCSPGHYEATSGPCADWHLCTHESLSPRALQLQTIKVLSCKNRFYEHNDRSGSLTCWRISKTYCRLSLMSYVIQRRAAWKTWNSESTRSFSEEKNSTIRSLGSSYTSSSFRICGKWFWM